MAKDTPPVSEFKFESSSTPGKFYTVTVEGESYDCTCPGFVYRKKCSHLEKAKKRIPAIEKESEAIIGGLKNIISGGPGIGYPVTFPIHNIKLKINSFIS